MVNVYPKVYVCFNCYLQCRVKHIYVSFAVAFVAGVTNLT